MTNLILLNNIGLLPEFFLGISIIYLLIFGSILSTYKKYPLIQNLILNLAILVLILCLCLVLNDQLHIQEFTLFNNSIIYDYLSFYTKIFILVFSIVCLLMIQNYIKYQKLNQFEYIIIILLAILGFLLLCSANDLITAYLAIELQSLSFYVMASFKKTSSFSVEAGLKYFVLGSFSSAILLLGSSLLYGATGSVNFSDFKDLYSTIYPGLQSNVLQNFNFESLVYSYSSSFLISTDLKQLNFSDFKDIYQCFYREYMNENFIEELLNINIEFYQNITALYNTNSLHFTINDYLLILTNLEILKYFEVFNNTSVCSIYDFRINQLFFNLLYFSKFLCDTYPKEIKSYENYVVSEDINLFEQFNNKILEFKQLMITEYPKIYGEDSIITDWYYNLYLEMCDNFLNSNFIFSTDLQDCNIFQNTYETDLLQIGLILILVSLLFKLAVAPLHAWSPDVYEGSPSSSTLFFAVVSKISIIVLLIRIFSCSFHGFIYNWRFYIVIISVVSILIGSFVALEQRKLKSLLAYSSTSHIGYILLAFCTGTLESIQSIFAYISIYMLAGSCIWSIFILLRKKSNFKYKTKTNKDLSDLASLIKSNRLLALIFTTVLFSIAGFPPLIGFFTKMNIFSSVIESSMFLVATISILTSVISTFYYIRIIKIICFENKLISCLYHPLPYIETFIIVVSFFLLIFLFINPTILYLLSHKISLLYFS